MNVPTQAIEDAEIKVANSKIDGMSEAYMLGMEHMLEFFKEWEDTTDV